METRKRIMAPATNPRRARRALPSPPARSCAGSASPETVGGGAAAVVLGAYGSVGLKPVSVGSGAHGHDLIGVPASGLGRTRVHERGGALPCRRLTDAPELAAVDAAIHEVAADIGFGIGAPVEGDLPAGGHRRGEVAGGDRR